MENNIENKVKPEIEQIFEVGFLDADDEFDSIKHIYDESEWYGKHNYKPRLPQHPKFQEIENIENKDNIKWKELKDIFVNEIYSSNYNLEIDKIKQQENFLVEVIKRLKLLKEKFNFVIFPEYKILFKTYGMSGSYNSDKGMIVLRRQDDPEFKYEITCIHEMIHIGIENTTVKKYNLSQIAKERLVDLICKIEFGDMAPTYKMQDIGDKRIDEYLLDSSGNFVENIEDAIARFSRDYPNNDSEEINKPNVY